ncbi:hypothetical protein QS306_06190 [Paraburkholderia bonniea]|uniref:hypothetical protein n=1 Tax=Paraburkholderia bonniea TaxID=2152891 RepID=UPI0025742D4A|nr:hypothetical protein [Paraburkholderia bonniea]WJF91221.1 hypothetical protein QS306_06190 [Paraburkholderia bonniea]WJF94535.1 hypothetical protein QS308_06195 [Paraburkholderia bonniea]
MNKIDSFSLVSNSPDQSGNIQPDRDSSLVVSGQEKAISIKKTDGNEHRHITDDEALKVSGFLALKGYAVTSDVDQNRAVKLIKEVLDNKYLSNEIDKGSRLARCREDFFAKTCKEYLNEESMRTFSAHVDRGLINSIREKLGQKSHDLMKKNILYVLGCIYEYCDDIKLNVLDCISSSVEVKDLNAIFFSPRRPGENDKGKLTVNFNWKWESGRFNFNDKVAYSTISVIYNSDSGGCVKEHYDFLNLEKLQELQFSQKTDKEIFARLEGNSSIKKISLRIDAAFKSEGYIKEMSESISKINSLEEVKIELTHEIKEKIEIKNLGGMFKNIRMLEVDEDVGKNVFPGNERLFEDLLGQIENSKIETLRIQTNKDFSRDLNFTLLSNIKALDLEVKVDNFSDFLDLALKNMNIKIIKLNCYRIVYIVGMSRSIQEDIENLVKLSFQKALNDSELRETLIFLSSAEVLEEFPDLKSYKYMLSSTKNAVMTRPDGSRLVIAEGTIR